MTYVTLSSKCQISLPARFLRALNLRPKDRIEIEAMEGCLRLRKAADFLALRGSAGGKRAPDEKAGMLRAVAAHVAGRRA